MDELHNPAATSAADRTPAIHSPVSLPVVTRECGECQACCEFLTIVEDEITKPAFEKCQHQCAAGCAIHNDPDQPKLCRTFQCVWKTGELPEDMRPDRCGVIVSNGVMDGYKLQAVVFRPGALTERVRYQINKAAKKRKGLVAYHTPRPEDSYVHLYNGLYFETYGVRPELFLSLYTLVPSQHVRDEAHAAGIADEVVAQAIVFGVSIGSFTVVQQEDGLAAGPILGRGGTTCATLVPKGKDELFPNGYRIEVAELV